MGFYSFSLFFNELECFVGIVTVQKIKLNGFVAVAGILIDENLLLFRIQVGIVSFVKRFIWRNCIWFGCIVAVIEPIWSYDIIVSNALPLAKVVPKLLMDRLNQNRFRAFNIYVFKYKQYHCH